jgi:phospholipid/cholesterol/gamma-HCH transport system substrate-binding protein
MTPDDKTPEEMGPEGKPPKGKVEEMIWKNLQVERDPERERERQENITEAAERRKAKDEAPIPGSRFHRYPRGHFRRQLRRRGVDAIAVAALIVLGLATMFVILGQQKSAIPSWVPILGQSFFRIDASFQTGQSITPGQGQAVDMSGVRIGKIDSVSLNDGHADVALDVEEQYAPLIHSDATFLLRPKTNLNDMVVEITPGSSPHLMSDGAHVPLSSTQPNVNPDEVLATLDTDTQRYLQLLLQGVGTGLQGRGGQLSEVWRRIYPFTRDIARVNGEVAKRRVALANVIHNFRLLSDALAAKDTEITNFVGSSEQALGHFANQANSLQAAITELPSTLRQTDTALTASNALSEQLGPALTKLTPQADAFAPALRRLQTFFTDTSPLISGQITPFTQQINPPVNTVRETAKPFSKTVAGFRDTLKPLNYAFNELAAKPSGSGQSYLFYLPWLNHNLSSGYLLQDAAGPLRRGTIMLTCQTATLANGFAGGRPFLRTLLQLANIPTVGQTC